MSPLEKSLVRSKAVGLSISVLLTLLFSLNTFVSNTIFGVEIRTVNAVLFFILLFFALVSFIFCRCPRCNTHLSGLEASCPRCP